MSVRDEILAIQRRVAEGEIDLRDVGKLLNGKFDQDLPAEILNMALDEAIRREAAK
jgi:hypothetical protein